MGIRILLNIALCFGYTILVTAQVTETSGQSLIFSLNMDHTEMVVDGNVGARVISLKSNGTEILGSMKLHNRFFGSTFWLGPQGKWKGYKEIDASPYSLEFYDQRELRLKSKNDSLNGFSVSKQFRMNLADSSYVIKYHVTNISKNEQKVSPWEVTRVPTGGLAFFPKGLNGDFPRGNEMHDLLNVMDSLGVIWYMNDSSISSDEKLFMDGSEGWMAYSRNETVFIKKFPSIDQSHAAPWEKNVEIYVNKENTYIELENQGEYQALPSGGSLTYEVKWYARHLPPNLKPEVGNIALVNYIRKVLGQKL